MDIRFYDATNPRKKRNNIEEDFESQFSAATAIFAYFLFKDKSKDNINQININCISNINTIKFYDVVDGFWDIDVPYDPNKFLSMDGDELKRKEFRIIFSEIFEEIFTYKNWDKNDLEKALSNSEEVGFKREFLLKGTPKKNPRKDKLAVVRCTEDIKSFQMICAIYDKNGYLLLERKIVETLPSPFVYSSFLGKTKWESDNVLTVEAQVRNWKEVIELL